MLCGNILAFPHSVAAPAGYTMPAAYWDGTTRLQVIANTGVKDGSLARKGAFSLWLKRENTATARVFQTNTSKVYLSVLADGRLLFVMTNSSGTIVQGRNSTAGVPNDGAWHHALIGWDLDVPSISYYIDGVLSSNSGGTLTQFGNPQFADGNFHVSSTSGLYTGCIGDYWMTQSALDISQQSVREYFRSSTGQPVQLPANGVLPNGVAPWIYFSGSAAHWGDYRTDGTGTNHIMNLVTGTALAACS